MNEIWRLKGKKIPANFDPSKSPFACKCSICTSWFDNFSPAYPQPPKTNKQIPSSCSSGVEPWWWAKGRGLTPFRNYCDDAYRRNITFFYICQNFMRNLDFLYLFFEKICLFQVVILKIDGFLHMLFCNIRLWKRLRHGLKIVYTVHTT